MTAQMPGGGDLEGLGGSKPNYAYYKIRVNIEYGSSMDLYLKSTGLVSIAEVLEVNLRYKSKIVESDIKTNIERITKKEYSKYLKK